MNTRKEIKKLVYKAHSHDEGMARTWNITREKQLNIALTMDTNEVLPGPMGTPNKNFKFKSIYLR